jgi:hypothetical protein
MGKAPLRISVKNATKRHKNGDFDCPLTRKRIKKQHFFSFSFGISKN